ncbi:MAG TPA: DNA alkylation repair protein [Gaiellaceae bacterium]
MGGRRRLADQVRLELERRADPAKAEPMRAYMKSAMPCLGVLAAGVREVCRAVHAESLDDVRDVWDGARFREERYLAIGLSKGFIAVESLPLFEHMIVTGAWWDLVDTIAIHRVGPLLPGIRSTISEWSRSDHLWKRRTSIICQIARKQETDIALLHECIEANLADRDFFIRKAIGWALRSRSILAPEEVRAFADTHELSPLSRREALRRIA